RADAVAAAAHALMDFVRRRQVNRTLLELHVEAPGVVEASVIAGERQIAASGYIAAVAIGRARRLSVVVGRAVLARREQRVEAENTADLGRLVPDRMIDSSAEFDPVVAAGIAHDHRI